jgi:ATP-dependent DNA helicase RecG
MKNVVDTTQEKILQAITGNAGITRKELSNIVQLTPDGVKYHLQQLTSKSIIKHIGSTKSGEWIIL